MDARTLATELQKLIARYGEGVEVVMYLPGSDYAQDSSMDEIVEVAYQPKMNKIVLS